MANKRPKHRSKSTEIKRKQDHRDRLLLKSTEKKANIILHAPKIIETPDESIISKRAKARAEYKEKIKEKFGLPSDTAFFHRGGHGKNDLLELKYGTVVILDTSGMKLIAVIRFNERHYIEDDGKRVQTEASERLFKKFEQSMSTMYQHGTARNKIRTNGPTIRVRKNRRGDMFAIGMRPGYLKGLAGGLYHINRVTACSVLLMDKDLRRQKNLPYIQHFLAGRFSSLALGAFQSNVQLCARYGNLSWASKSFFNSPNGNAFGANFVMTRDEWHNTVHNDRDATGYSFGIFGLIKRLTGKLYQRGKKSRHGYVKDGFFWFPDQNVRVCFEACDGVVEMVWATDVGHQTTESTTHDSTGHRINPKDAVITRFGSSCQVSKSIVSRINGITKLRGNMDEEEWKIFRETKVENYVIDIKRKCQLLRKVNSSQK